ncbi:MAG TPA: hypothetical protein VGN26_03455 [Armatimonadota bacterium]|jgi:hydrogenase-4 component E
MHLSNLDALTAAAALVAVWMCGVTRLQCLFWGLALQTAGIAAVTAMVGMERHQSSYLLLALVVALAKAVAIPSFLTRTSDRVGAPKDRGVLLAPPLPLFAGCGALAMGFFLTESVAGHQAAHPGAAGMAVSLLLIGMLLMLTRRLAISQVVGFLVLENGIFLYALTQTHGMPLMVEMGVVLDLLVAVMVSGLLIFRLNSSFEHIDVSKLRRLRH